jgi:hypothetical protein
MGSHNSYSDHKPAARTPSPQLQSSNILSIALGSNKDKGADSERPAFFAPDEFIIPGIQSSGFRK